MSCFKFGRKKNMYEFNSTPYQRSSGGSYRMSQSEVYFNTEETNGNVTSTSPPKVNQIDSHHIDNAHDHENHNDIKDIDLDQVKITAEEAKDNEVHRAPTPEPEPEREPEVHVSEPEPEVHTENEITEKDSSDKASQSSHHSSASDVQRVTDTEEHTDRNDLRDYEMVNLPPANERESYYHVTTTQKDDDDDGFIDHSTTVITTHTIMTSYSTHPEEAEEDEHKETDSTHSEEAGKAKDDSDSDEPTGYDVNYDEENAQNEAANYDDENAANEAHHDDGAKSDGDEDAVAALDAIADEHDRDSDKDGHHTPQRRDSVEDHATDESTRAFFNVEED